MRGHGDGAGDADVGGPARGDGKLHAKEETCEEGDTALRLSTGVDAGLLSVSTQVISRRLRRNKRSVSV